MQFVAAGAAALAVGGIASGCGSEPKLVHPTDMTSSPCDLLPPAVVTALDLVRETDLQKSDRISSRASCSMSGTIDGEAIALSMVVESPTFQARDEDELLKRKQEAAVKLEDRECSTLKDASLSFDDDDGICVGTITSEDGTATTVIDRLPSEVSGIVKVVIQSRGPMWDRVEDSASAYAVEVAEHVAATAPEDLLA